MTALYWIGWFVALIAITDWLTPRRQGGDFPDFVITTAFAAALALAWPVIAALVFLVFMVRRRVATG